MAQADVLAALNAFFGRWRLALEERALVRFEAGPLPQAGLTAAVKADAFSQGFGFKPISFNWEMLDPGDDLAAPRSARGTICEALTNDMVDYTTPWLGAERALQCGDDFLASFDPARLCVVSNHLNGLWYPISGASDEWSFAAMDDAVIALLVVAARR